MQRQPRNWNQTQRMHSNHHETLYGLRTSSERWHAHFFDSLQSLSFIYTRFDNGIWIRRNNNLGKNNSYNYICSYVDNFMIVSKNPATIMEEIKQVYTVISVGPPEYYFGNNYKKDQKECWSIGYKKYIFKAIKKFKQNHGILKKFNNLSKTGDYPNNNTSEPLDNRQHQQF